MSKLRYSAYGGQSLTLQLSCESSITKIYLLINENSLESNVNIYRKMKDNYFHSIFFNKVNLAVVDIDIINDSAKVDFSPEAGFSSKLAIFNIHTNATIEYDRELLSCKINRKKWSLIKDNFPFKIISTKKTMLFNEALMTEALDFTNGLARTPLLFQDLNLKEIVKKYLNPLDEEN